MGRKGSGVEVRESSLRLSFVLGGKKQRHTLTVNGKPLAPTPSNIRYAERLAVEIRDKIRHGTFSLVEYFPDAVVDGAGTVGSQLKNWLATQRVEKSTKDGYISAI